jgi:small GTP-binding protein
MQHIKCVVVGDGTVGKTCLLITYTMKAFPKDYVPTVFDNYNAVVLWDGQPINLGLWDTAGQDDFQVMRPMSYQNADIFLIFFAIDNPVSFQNVKHKWFPEITKGETREVPRILVGTKSDCREDEARLSELRQKNIKPITWKQGKKLSRELGCVSYIECSAITNRGFRDVFGQVVAAIINLRNGKKPGAICWSTKCNKEFTLLSKKHKCVRCSQFFCPDCVVLLPKSHEWGNKLICKKCRDIEDDEPLKRDFKKKLLGRRKANKKGEDEEEEEAGGDGEDSKKREATPLSRAELLASAQGRPLGNDEEDEDHKEGNDEDQPTAKTAKGSSIGNGSGSSSGMSNSSSNNKDKEKDRKKKKKKEIEGGKGNETTASAE